MVFLYGGSIAEIGTPREYTVSNTEYHTSPVKRIVGILVAMMKETTETYRPCTCTLRINVTNPPVDCHRDTKA
jgi:hypothetical protein